MIQLNTYTFEDGNVGTAESMIQTYDSQRNGFASLSFDNFDNDALPVLKKGSIIEIKGSLYQADTDETVKYFNGTAFFDAGTCPENTDLFLCLIPTSVAGSETNILTLSIASIASYEFDHEYRGWYQLNTTTRIIGGVKRVGTGYPKTNKWLMTNNSLSYNSENPASPMLRMYSDGFEANIRKMQPCYKIGGFAPIYSNASINTQMGYATIDLTTITLNYISAISISAVGEKYMISGLEASPTCTVYAVLMVNDIETITYEIGTLTAGTVTIAQNLLAGTYKIRLVGHIGVHKWSVTNPKTGTTTNYTHTDGYKLNSMTITPVIVVGSRMGDF